jgi:hypothetical protein
MSEVRFTLFGWRSLSEHGRFDDMKGSIESQSKLAYGVSRRKGKDIHGASCLGNSQVLLPKQESTLVNTTKILTETTQYALLVCLRSPRFYRRDFIVL